MKLTPENLSLEKDILTPTLALLAILLAFLYFSLGWATNRMKDWEQTGAQVKRLGSPALVVWVSLVGCIAFTIIGTMFYGSLYLWLNGAWMPQHILGGVIVLAEWTFWWVCIIRLFALHWQWRGIFRPFRQAMYEKIVDYRKWWVLHFIGLPVFGWIDYSEFYFGDFTVALMGMCFCFVTTAGLGCYISLYGDLFPRSLEG